MVSRSTPRRGNGSPRPGEVAETSILLYKGDGLEGLPQAGGVAHLGRVMAYPLGRGTRNFHFTTKVMVSRGTPPRRGIRPGGVMAYPARTGYPKPSFYFTKVMVSRAGYQKPCPPGVRPGGVPCPGGVMAYPPRRGTRNLHFTV